MPLTVKASEARAQFPTIAKRVYEDNIEVTVIKGSKPYVKIVPIDDNASDGENGTMYLDATWKLRTSTAICLMALSKGAGAILLPYPSISCSPFMKTN